MELSNEAIVTKILSSKEILYKNKLGKIAIPSDYNLGMYLEKVKNAPSPFGEKYIFIK